MSDRLTSAWTATTPEAFGASGVKGDAGEQFLLIELRKWGWLAELTPDKDNQIKGIDIRFKSPNWVNYYTADVKNNLRLDGSFVVETDPKGWLFNPAKVSDRIWHVNPATGKMVWYDRKRMQAWVRANVSKNKLLTLSVSSLPDFCTVK
jgi:hypothetical protein